MKYHTLTGLLLLLTTPLLWADNVPPPDVDGVITKIQATASKIRDATYIFHKQEYADGNQRPGERIAVKFRVPNDVYMKWLGPTHRGRELLFRPGWNKDRLRISPGRWLPTLNLDPRGDLAMRGNRHSIYQLPFPAIIANFLNSTALIRANPALRAHITDLGQQNHFDEAGHCHQLQLPKDREPRLYATEVILCFSQRTGLPLHIQSWDMADGQLRQVENYHYEDVRVNVGLSDSDFDPDNPAYNF